MEKIRDNESRGNNDMICHATTYCVTAWHKVFCTAEKQYSPLISRQFAKRLSFLLISCVGVLEMNLALHRDLLFPKPDSCLFILVKIPVFNPRKMLYTVKLEMLSASKISFCFNPF